VVSQGLDVAPGVRELVDLSADSAVSVKGGGVIATAEQPADFRE